MRADGVKKKDGTNLYDYTAAINKLLEIWTCWVYGVVGGILFPPLQTQTQTLRAERAAGGKKKTKTKRKKTLHLLGCFVVKIQ